MENTQSVVLALGRLNQEDEEFEASLDYIVNPKLAWLPEALSQNKQKGAGEMAQLPPATNGIV